MSNRKWWHSADEFFFLFLPCLSSGNMKIVIRTVRSNIVGIFYQKCLKYFGDGNCISSGQGQNTKHNKISFYNTTN